MSGNERFGMMRPSASRAGPITSSRLKYSCRSLMRGQPELFISHQSSRLM